MKDFKGCLVVGVGPLWCDEAVNDGWQGRRYRKRSRSPTASSRRAKHGLDRNVLRGFVLATANESRHSFGPFGRRRNWSDKFGAERPESKRVAHAVARLYELSDAGVVSVTKREPPTLKDISLKVSQRML